jgi:hypothetical protein
MITKVDIYELEWAGDEPKDVKIGTITNENGVITGDTPEAQSIVQAPVYAYSGDMRNVYANQDPERYMQLLPQCINSIWLRAIAAS